MKHPDHFLSCDWGTTSFRLRLASLADGEVACELKEPSGVKAIVESLPKDLSAEAMADARTKAFEEFLGRKIAELDASLSSGQLPIVVSGMASSTVGWKEISYAHTPFPLDGTEVRYEEVLLEAEGKEHPVYLLSGLQTESDIMRGEETEVLGLYASGEFPDVFEAGIVLLPGTHSKHVSVRDGIVEDFQTHMTGELFEVLSKHSLLSATVADDNEIDSRTQAALVEGVRAAQGGGVSRSLFQVRTRSVLQGIDPAENYWFLSGLLIGAEVDDLVAQPTDGPILVAAPSKVAVLYEQALKTLGKHLTIQVASHELLQRAAILGQAAWLRNGVARL